MGWSVVDSHGAWANLFGPPPDRVRERVMDSEPNVPSESLLDSGQRIVQLLGLPAAQAFLDVLTRSDEDRADVVRRLFAREDARWLAEVLMDIEEEPDDLTRMRLIAELQEALNHHQQP